MLLRNYLEKEKKCAKIFFGWNIFFRNMIIESKLQEICFQKLLQHCYVVGGFIGRTFRFICENISYFFVLEVMLHHKIIYYTLGISLKCHFLLAWSLITEMKNFLKKNKCLALLILQEYLISQILSKTMKIWNHKGNLPQKRIKKTLKSLKWSFKMST